uniref:porin n=1 Tax=Ensifer adhaerens TaxID=106592 RepID=UPI0008074567
ETCLKIGGFIRFQTSFGRDASTSRYNQEDFDFLGNGGPNESTSDWDAFSRAYISFDAKSDTEYGTLTGFFAAEFNADNDTDSGDSDFIDVDEAYIQLGGLKAGFFYNWWDKGINGETDTLGNVTEFNSIAYLYYGGSFQAGISVDELEGWSTKANGIGISGIVSASVGGVSFDLLGGYDTEWEEGAIRGLLSADLGPGVFQLAGIWASNPNTYWKASEWSVAASYAFKATDKLKITPGVQYWDSLQTSFTDFGDDDMWRAGVTLDYAITEGLATRISVQYEDKDNADEQVKGFVRLQRNF